MGIGDWIMATGIVKVMHKKTNLPTLIVRYNGQPQWSEVFNNNPKILREAPKSSRYNRLVNHSGARPYIVAKTPTQWIWRTQQTPMEPGEFYFSQEELRFGQQNAGTVMIEPNGKNIGHTNKEWIWERWQELANRLTASGIDVVQCGSSPLKRLSGVRFVETGTFRLAASVLSNCKTFVGAEGGLMHAAAAVGVRSVILWSEFISPEVTGYKMHVNIRHAGRVCGLRTFCKSCAESMEAITVDEVEEQTLKVIK